MYCSFQVKEEAGNDIFRSAADVVEAILTDEVPHNEHCAALPKPNRLSRCHNREKLRADEPHNLGFEVSSVHYDDGDFQMFKITNVTNITSDV